MKKILNINAIIILLFSSLLTYFTFKNNDTAYWNYWGVSFASQEIYLKNTGYTGEDLYQLLTTLAEETDVNIVKSDYLEDKNSTKIVKSIYISDDKDDLFKDNRVDYVFKADRDQNDNNAFISTKQTQDSNQKGIMFDPFHDDNVEFWTLKGFQNKRGNLDGTYIIRAQNQESVQLFVETFAERSGISLEELTKQTTFIGTMKSPVETISLFATIISLILFGILSIYYAVNNIKKIGVMKLNGYSNYHVWLSLLLNIITTMIFAALFLDVIIQFVLKNLTRDFMLWLIVVQSLLISVLIIISSVIYFIIRKNTISNLVKNKKPIRLITGTTYLVKSVLLFVIIAFIVFMTAGFNNIELEYRKLEQWGKVGELAVLVNVNVGNDQASFTQGDIGLQSDFADYYTHLNQQGAMYILAEEFVPHVLFKTEFNEVDGSLDYVDYFDQDAVPQEFSTTNILVNPNYLKEYPLQDVNGNVIDVKEQGDRTILIPDTMADKEEALRSIYTAKYIDALLASDRNLNIEHERKQEVAVTSIVYKTDQQGYFTFHTNYEDSDYLTYEPVFEVIPEQHMTMLEKGNIQMQGIQSPLKVKLNDMTSNEYNQQLYEIASTYHLDDNALRYMTIKEVFGNEIQSLKQAIQQYIIAIVICFMIMVLITIQLTQMMLETEKKKYCIQKLYGYRFLDRYKKLLIWNSGAEILITILALLIAPSLMSVTLSTAAFLMVVPLLCINIGLVCFLLMYFENKNLAQIVKGE